MAELEFVDIPAESEGCIGQEDPYGDHLSITCVPCNYQSATEEENIRQLLQEGRSASSTIAWPAKGQNPINEFSTEGYFSCAFPVLFPTGAADFLAPCLNTVTIGNYFKRLLLYHDGRFAKHCRFRYFVLNTEMRWCALQTGKIYIHQNPDDDHLSIEELRDMMGREGENFSNRIIHFAASLRGTRQHWLRQRSRLIAMVDSIGMPTIFFTHRTADFQWPELAHLFSYENSTTIN